VTTSNANASLPKIKRGYRANTQFILEVVGFSIAIGLICALVVPLNVTVDGIFYLANSKSLFSPDFSELFTWYREPGYPFFLRAVTALVGNSGVALIFIQGAVLGYSAIVSLSSLYWVSGHGRIPRPALIMTLVLTLNPMFLDYSGLILQQAIFAGFLASFAALLALSIRRPDSVRPWIIPIATMITYAAAVSTSVGWIYLGLLPTAAIMTIGAVKMTNASSKKSKLQPRHVILVALLFALSVAGTNAIGVACYQVWDSFKESNRSQSQEKAFVIKPLSGVPSLPTPESMVRSSLAIMHMGTVDGYEYENDVFLAQQMRLNFPKSSWDTAFVSEPFSSYALNVVTPSDPSFLGHAIFSIVALIASPAYTLVFILLGASTFLLIIRRQWPAAMISAVPIQFVLVYAASNSPIDRYGVPTYGLAVAVVVYVGERLIHGLNKRKSLLQQLPS
jgi:hypothetical protein